MARLATEAQGYSQTGMTAAAVGPGSFDMSGGDGMSLQCLGTGSMWVLVEGEQAGGVDCGRALGNSIANISGGPLEGAGEVTVDVAEDATWAVVVTQTQ
ncbi:hypothetical protein [Kytococcus sedentarius]|uniref:hypothetical protein n=1 Tax=Kytococcus sedentarius TaxID=1276 RepID=UPI0035BC15BC